MKLVKLVCVQHAFIEKMVYVHIKIEACDYCASIGYEVTEDNCKYYKEKIINFEDHKKNLKKVIKMDKKNI